MTGVAGRERAAAPAAKPVPIDVAITSVQKTPHTPLLTKPWLQLDKEFVTSVRCFAIIAHTLEGGIMLLSLECLLRRTFSGTTVAWLTP